MKYKATNDKVVDTDKMERVLDMDYEGCYGTVSCDLYRTKKSHTWYKVSESSWAGNCNISDAEVLECGEVAALLAEEFETEEIVERYPEIAKHLETVMDI